MKAVFKINNGEGALICSGCSKILKVESEFDELEQSAFKGIDYLQAQYCNECKSENNDG